MASSRHFHELEVEAAERDARRIEGLRARRAERVERFMDARTRTSGMDYDALARQIEEKDLAKRAAAEERAAAVAESSRTRTVVAAMDRETAAARAAVGAAHLRAIQAQIDAAPTRTTADLVGSRAAARLGGTIRADRDSRGVDSDPRLGPASAQVFAGEDPLAPERRALQLAQTVAWTEQAAADKAAVRAAEAAERAEYVAYLAHVRSVGEEVEERALAARKRAAAAVRVENAAAAEARRAAAAAARVVDKAEEEKALATFSSRAPGEVGAGYHFLAGDLSDAKSAASDRRIRVDHYRGLPVASHAATLREVAGQIAEKEIAAVSALTAATEDVAYDRSVAVAAARVERAAAAARAEANRRQLEALQRQVEEAAERRRREEAERRAVRVTDDFYSRFGTSDR